MVAAPSRVYRSRAASSIHEPGRSTGMPITSLSRAKPRLTTSRKTTSTMAHPRKSRKILSGVTAAPRRMVGTPRNAAIVTGSTGTAPRSRGSAICRAACVAPCAVGRTHARSSSDGCTLHKSVSFTPHMCSLIVCYATQGVASPPLTVSGC